MNSYIEEDLLPQVAERLEYSQGTLMKLNKFQNAHLKENMTHRFKESCFWDYAESYHPCPGYHYFNINLEKFINKPLSGLIAKCRNHPLYTKHKGFKRQVDEKIFEMMNEPQRWERASGSNFWEDHYTDESGIIRLIEDHPAYKVVPRKEAIYYRNWKNPNQITTVSKKKIVKSDEGIHYFVSSFEDDRFLWKTSIHGNLKKVLNPVHFKIPLTYSELQLYKLTNTPKE